MGSDVEMSLEEIITKNKKKKVLNRKPIRTKNGNYSPKKVAGKPTGLVGGKVADARNKLILKRRTQIGDLRDKLAFMSKRKDARVKLEQMRLKKIEPERHINRGIQENRRLQRNLMTNIHRGFSDLSRQVRSGPPPALPKFSIDRQIGYKKPKLSALRSERITSGYPRAVPGPILRTVENDVYVQSQPIVIEDDDYNVPIVTRTNAFNLKIVTHNDKATGFSTKSSEKRQERMPPSILKKRPMAALRMDREGRSPVPASPPASPPHHSPEYRIIVSNLRSSVTGTDIQELFGDVGGLIESRLVRAGTAEVIYRSLEDAQRAVELYHNRQLDGQPMNCLLVNPRTAIAASGRLGGSAKSALPPSGTSTIVPDIDTFHKVLFSNRR